MAGMGVGGEDMDEGEEAEVDQYVAEAVEGGLGGGGVLALALEVTGLLTHYAEPGSITLVDAQNGFNDLSRLMILWMVHHRFLEGARDAFNCYRHWAYLLLCLTGDVPVILLSQKGFTQGDPLSMVLYGITHVPLAEELRDTDPTLFSTFYTDDAEFDRLARRSPAQLQLLMDQGPDRGYFPEPAKSLFVAENPE